MRSVLMCAMMLVMPSVSSAQCRMINGRQVCNAAPQMIIAEPVMVYGSQANAAPQAQMETVSSSGSGVVSRLVARRIARNERQLNRLVGNTTVNATNQTLAPMAQAVDLPELQWQVDQPQSMATPCIDCQPVMAPQSMAMPCVDCQPVMAPQSIAVNAYQPTQYLPRVSYNLTDFSRQNVYAPPVVQQVAPMTIPLVGPQVVVKEVIKEVIKEVPVPGPRGPAGPAGRDAVLDPSILQDYGQQLGSQLFSQVMSALPDITLEFENHDGTIERQTQRLAEGHATFKFKYVAPKILNNN